MGGHGTEDFGNDPFGFESYHVKRCLGFCHTKPAQVTFRWMFLRASSP